MGWLPLLLLILPTGAVPKGLRPFRVGTRTTAFQHFHSLGRTTSRRGHCCRQYSCRLWRQKQDEEESFTSDNYNATSSVDSSTALGEEEGEEDETNERWKFPFPVWDETKQRPSTTSTIFKSFVFQDRVLWIGDVATMFVACQLMGLADVLSNLDFWANGGFFQPLTVPTTLGTLMQRTSFGVLAWTAMSIKNGAYAEDSRYSFAGEDSDNNDSDENSAQKVELLLMSTIHTLIDFCCLKVMSCLWTANFVTHGPVDVMDLIRQCWFVAILLSAFRIVYGRWYYSSP